MSDGLDFNSLLPDRVFDGGDLDCGSGLILLIRENMLEVPDGGILEMRSREPTVKGELPPWCRMVGHEYLGAIDDASTTARHFVRKGAAAAEAEASALDEDKQKAADYEWRLRVRATGHLEATAYCRNFSFKAGQPASFEEKDAHPSSIELLLGSLGTALTTGFATEATRAGLEIDDIELTVRGRLGNPLAHLGLGEGDPGLTRIELKCFATTLADEDATREAWRLALERSPVAVTLGRTAELDTKLVVL